MNVQINSQILSQSSDNLIMVHIRQLEESISCGGYIDLFVMMDALSQYQSEALLRGLCF